MQEGHLPVMPDEVMDDLAPAPGSLQIDATRRRWDTSGSWRPTNPDGRPLGLDGTRRPSQGRPSPRPVSATAWSCAGRTSASREVAPDGGFGAGGGTCSTSGCRSSSSPTASAASAPGRRPLTCASTQAAASRPASCSRRSTKTSSPRCSVSSARSRRAGRIARGDRRGPATPRSRPPRSSPRSSSASPRQPAQAAAGSIPPRASSRRCGSRSTRSSTRSRRARRRGGLLRPGGRLVVLQLPLARGPHRQAVLPGRAARLHLPARGPGLRLRPARRVSASSPDRR